MTTQVLQKNIFHLDDRTDIKLSPSCETARFLPQKSKVWCLPGSSADNKIAMWISELANAVIQPLEEEPKTLSALRIDLSLQLLGYCHGYIALSNHLQFHGILQRFRHLIQKGDITTLNELLIHYQKMQQNCHFGALNFLLIQTQIKLLDEIIFFLKQGHYEEQHMRNFVEKFNTHAFCLPKGRAIVIFQNEKSQIILTAEGKLFFHELYVDGNKNTVFESYIQNIIIEKMGKIGQKNEKKIREEIGKLDTFAREIFYRNIFALTPEEVLMIIKKRFEEPEKGFRIYQGLPIGEGSASVVYSGLLCRSGQKNQRVAIKKVRSHDENGNLISEKMLKILQKEFTAEKYKAEIIMQYQKNGLLHGIIKPVTIQPQLLVYVNYQSNDDYVDLIEGCSKKEISPREVWDSVADAAESIAELHEVGLVHRDLKLENIVMAFSQDKGLRGEICLPRAIIIDIGSMNTRDELKKTKFYWKNREDKDIELPEGIMPEAIEIYFKNLGFKEIPFIYPAQGGITPEYYDWRAAMSAVRSLQYEKHDIHFALEDYSAFGKILEQIAIYKPIPLQHHGSFIKLIQGLKSHNPQDSCYQYIHTELSGFFGLAEVIRRMWVDEEMIF